MATNNQPLIQSRVAYPQTHNNSEPPRPDFDQWAAAVKQQMVAALQRRRNS